MSVAYDSEMKFARLLVVFGMIALWSVGRPAFAACGSEYYPTTKDMVFYANSAQAIEDVQSVVEELAKQHVISNGQYQSFESTRDQWRSAYAEYHTAFDRYAGELQKVIDTTGSDQVNHCGMAESESKRFLATKATMERVTDTMVMALRDMRTRSGQSNDPLSSQQLYLKLIGFDTVALTAQLQPVTVAVIDDGVYVNHEDLRAHMWENPKEIAGNGIDDDQNGFVDDVFGYDFLSNRADVTVRGSHGTHVAGVIAAVANNHFGIQGVAQNARIMSLIACDANGLCDANAVVRAIRYAVDNGAKIINLSISSGGSSSYSSGYDSAIQYAYEHGVLVVAAAGNGDKDSQIGQDLNAVPQSPVCNDVGQNMVLGVGAVNDFGLRTTWSNYGSNCVDVFAPGEDILSTAVPNLDGGQAYTSEDGTSLAAPQVSGLAAILKGLYPEMNPKELIEHIKNTSWQQIVSFQKAIGFRYNPSPIVLSTPDKPVVVPMPPQPTVAASPSQNLVCGSHEQLNQKAQACVCLSGYVRSRDTKSCVKDVFVGTPRTKAQYGKCEVIALPTKKVWYPKAHKKLRNVAYRSMECYASSQMAELFGYRKGK